MPAILAALLICNGSAQATNLVAAQPVPGVYEGLILAVDSRGSLTGYYREDQGIGVVKHCSFFLAGQAGVGEFPIKTWSEEVIPGTLQANETSVRLKIGQGRDHPGCGTVLPPEITTGLTLDRIVATRWTALRWIVVARGHFYSAPQMGSKQRSYVVRGDVVGVLAQSRDWLHVAYAGTNRMITGWMPAAFSAPLAPP